MQYDLKNSRSFLRRSKVDNVRMCDLFLGSSLNILGRQLTLVDYANDFTRKRLGYKTERYRTSFPVCDFIQFFVSVILLHHSFGCSFIMGDECH